MTPPSNRWTVLAVAGLALVTALMTWFSATAVLPELTVHLSLSAAQAGWLTNAVQLGFVCGALGASLLSIPDLVRPTRLIPAAAVMAALANGAILADIGATGVFVARFLTGVALAGVYPPALKFIATWFDKGRGLAMGLMVGALTLGSAMPHLVKGIGLEVNWQAVILASSVGSLMAALIFGFLLTEGPLAFPKTAFDLGQIRRVITEKPVMLANLGYFGHMWELYAMWAWFLSFAAASSAAEAWNVSVLAFMVIAMGAPSSVIAGAIADRLGRALTAGGCMVISGSCALLIGVVFDGPAWAFVLVAAFWGLTVVADSAQFSAAVSELADRALVGTALTFQMGVGFAITVVTIWLMPHIVEALGSWRWAFATLALGPLVGSIAMVRLHRMTSTFAQR